MRVQANTLRSAVMAHALAGLTGSDPADLANVNTARRTYLGLLPVRELSGDGGLGAVIEALRPENGCDHSRIGLVDLGSWPP